MDISILDTIIVYASSSADDEVAESFKNKDVARVSANTENYTFEINKKVIESALEKGPELVLEGIKEVAPKLGIAAAAGKAAAEAVKQTSGVAPRPRLLAIGGAAFATATGTSLGLELGKTAAENTKKGSDLVASKSAEVPKDEPDSPTAFNRDFIHSVLEESETIPLIVMVNGLSYLNCLELSLVFSLFSLLFRKIIIRKLKDIIIKFIQKIKKTNKQKFKEVESIKDKDIDKKVPLNQAISTLDKYTDLIVVFIFICLF